MSPALYQLSYLAKTVLRTTSGYDTKFALPSSSVRPQKIRSPKRNPRRQNQAPGPVQPKTGLWQMNQDQNDAVSDSPQTKLYESR